MAVSIELNHVWKKFHRGEFNDCLRDAIPAMVKSLFGWGPKRDELQEKDFWSLKDIDFKVEEGETLGIIGHNGAGKSTLLKILSSIIEPNRGSMRVHGKLRSLIEIGSGFHGDLTGRENIYLNGAILGMTQKEISRKFDSIVDFSGIEEFLDMPVKRYSSGMYARLGFAVAAHLDPDILIVDEVLSVGDTEFQKKCLGKMNDVACEGRTVLFVSHNMPAVRNLCRRAILLNHGEMVADGPTEEVIRGYLKQCETNINKPLSERTDHIGNGDIRFVDLTMECNGQPMGEFIPIGAGMKITLKYTCKKPIESPVFCVTFYDDSDVPILALNTQITSRRMGPIAQEGTFVFDIPALPLLPRSWYLNIAAHNGKSQEDRVIHAYDFNVIPGKLGEVNVPVNHYGFFMTPYDWSLHD